LNVFLPPELARLVNEKVESGLYNSPSEVLRDALRLLEERDILREHRLQELRREIAVGLHAAEQGRVQVFDDESLRVQFEEIKARGRARLAEQPEKSPR
jgi:antitoxin ParD1/3/4